VSFSGLSSDKVAAASLRTVPLNTNLAFFSASTLVGIFFSVGLPPRRDDVPAAENVSAIL